MGKSKETNKFKCLKPEQKKQRLSSACVKCWKCFEKLLWPQTELWNRSRYLESLAQSYSELIGASCICSYILQVAPSYSDQQSYSELEPELLGDWICYSELNVQFASGSWCYSELEPEATRRPDLLFGASCSYQIQSLFVGRLGTKFTSFIISLVFSSM